jgi:IS5 family transposase
MAKKRARAIDYSRGQDKKHQLYRELIAATRATLAALQEAAEQLVGTDLSNTFRYVASRLEEVAETSGRVFARRSWQDRSPAGGPQAAASIPKRV